MSPNAWTDVGVSQLIVDGKTKLKNDAQISRFIENGVEFVARFVDGSMLDTDAVIFVTGK